MKNYLFKPGSKIVHKETKEIKRIARINVREDTYDFHQKGTKTLKSISVEEIEENYRIWEVKDNWLNL